MVGYLSLQSNSGLDGLPIGVSHAFSNGYRVQHFFTGDQYCDYRGAFQQIIRCRGEGADFILIHIMGLFKFIPYCSIAELCHKRESLSRIIIPLWCSSDREARKLAPLGAF